MNSRLVDATHHGLQLKSNDESVAHMKLLAQKLLVVTTVVVGNFVIAGSRWAVKHPDYSRIPPPASLYYTPRLSLNSPEYH